MVFMDKIRYSQEGCNLVPFLQNILKGMAIGAANVVPGLSGGTIALLLNVFERLIESIKSFDLKAIRLLLCGRLREFARHSDFLFLLAIFMGLLLGNVLLAKLFDYLFTYYRVLTWAFFFGLVLASLFFVSKNISHWSLSSGLALLCGASVAFVVTALPPAGSNAALWYLVLCGIIAISSMILPGLSGSYILILLGNYQLVMIEGVSQFRWDILGPFLLGALFGILAFARLLSCLLKKYYNQTIALLCGFIVGSLRSLWPWKHKILQGLDTKIVGYDYFVPQWDSTLVLALLLCLLGVALIVLIEAIKYYRTKHPK